MRTCLLLPVVMLLLLFQSGCEEDVGQIPENQAPITYLSIVGADFDSTDYRKILHWWGTDTDGEVSSYLIRWNGGWIPPAGTEREYLGLTYSQTTATQDTFDVPLHGTGGLRSFTVRAIDDQDLIDPTGVTQEFPLKNNAPSLSWNPSLPRPAVSLPAVAFGWNPTDFDGRSTVTTFKMWLDGDSANAVTVTDTTVALFPDDFGDRIDQERTVYVQAFDDALASSNIISHTWTVESPRGDWLLIDQITGAGSDAWDRPVFEAVLDSITAGSLHVIDLVDGPDFVTEQEIAPLFALFEGVVWVTGPYKEANDIKMASNLRTAERGIRAYVESGGKVLIAGQSAIGTRGGLSDRFMQEMLGVPDYYEIRVEPEGTRITDLVLTRNEYVYFEVEGQVDSLMAISTSRRVDYFLGPISPGTGLYWVPPGALEQMSGSSPIPEQNVNPAYLGAIAEHGEGRICLVTNSYARFFPRQAGYEGDWEAAIHEAVRLFREVFSP